VAPGSEQAENERFRRELDAAAGDLAGSIAGPSVPTGSTLSGSADPPSIPPRASGTVPGRLPGLATLRRYERIWLAPDVVGGIVLTAILAPVGMG
jgi:hypothetical protein